MTMSGKYDCEAAQAKLVQASPALRRCRDAIEADWSPDVPPTTIVFAALGRCLSSDSESISLDETKSIWACVEELFVSGNEEVRNGIATGFVEAVLGDVSAGRLKADTFAALLGEETVTYCRAWNKLTGCTIEGID